MNQSEILLIEKSIYWHALGLWSVEGFGDQQN